jgi:hypothetical protein
MSSGKLRKFVYSAFALVLGLGYLTALANLYLTHEMADGKPGMSYQDIIAHFHGDRDKTLLSSMIQGAMKPNLKDEKQMHDIQDWIKRGAKKDDFDPILQILNDQCVKCHNPFGAAAFRPLTNYEEVAKTTVPDTGIAWARLVMISHQHLFGIGLLCLALSMILLTTPLPNNIKFVVIFIGFSGVLFDIGGWWLTKLSASMAFLVAIGGAMNGIFFGVAVFTTWYDLFFGKDEPK